MIFLDTNFILRYLVSPSTPEIEVMAESARSLFAAVERGDVLATTTEVVLHEVAYIMTSKGHYARSVDEVTTALATIVRLPGFRLPRGEKKRFLAAIDLWETYPTLGFADALVATTAKLRGAELATFDREFNRIPGLNLWNKQALPNKSSATSV